MRAVSAIVVAAVVVERNGPGLCNSFSRHDLHAAVRGPQEGAMTCARAGVGPAGSTAHETQRVGEMPGVPCADRQNSERARENDVAAVSALAGEDCFGGTPGRPEASGREKSQRPCGFGGGVGGDG